MTFEHTTSQVLFDRDGHRCIRFSSLVKGEGVQANQFLIIDQQRAAVLDPGGDLTYMPLTMELNKYTRLENLDYVMVLASGSRYYYLYASLAGLYECQSGGFKTLGTIFTAFKFNVYE